MVNVSVTHTKPRIIKVTFEGVLSQSSGPGEGAFHDMVLQLQAEPFRVVCDFRATSAMSPELADLFAKGQAFALRHGMERDAFVSRSQVLRLQLGRVALESARLHALGPLRFFDTLDEAYAYILQPASELPARRTSGESGARRLG